jgi:hypothetical protein
MGGGMFTYNTWARDKGETKKDAAPPKEKGESKPEVATNAPAPAEAAKRGPAAEAVEPNRSRQINELLAKKVNFDGADDPKTHLSEVLDELAVTYNLTFVVNERAFEAAGIKDVLNTLMVTDKKPLPKLKGVRFSTVLTKILSRVVPGSEFTTAATFVVRPDHIEITTEAWLRNELGLPPANAVPSVGLLALATASFEKTPLDQALKEIADSTGFNIVLDSAKLEKNQPTVTASFQNVPVDTAVHILAEMADLRAVLLDNVLFVTSKDAADRLKKADDKRKDRDTDDNVRTPEKTQKP